MSTIPNTAGAVDLDQVARANADDNAEQHAQERRAAIESINYLDRGLQRIFKGIVSRPVRRGMMLRAMDRMANDYKPPERHHKLRNEAPRKRRGPGGGGKRKDGPRR